MMNISAQAVGWGILLVPIVAAILALIAGANDDANDGYD